ncbi:flagellar protein FlgN [Cellulosilyticum sp. I15G10I2]|uniref:flagellar protein FlgN n=1 Tax=Cellulosilyticum sp. I15G10I2 TaxID=1892843 RepID=UPI00085CA196|nr:flagellar protein FlgN [Cellulosilyticum sp. I15G10I2]
MAGIVYELIEVLEEQKECYEGLLTLAKYKQDAVVDKNLDLLQEIVTTEEQFVGRTSLLDKKREVLLKDISIVTGMDYNTLSVSKIVEKLGRENETSQKLLTLRDALSSIIQQLKKQNELNTVLINHSLELVDFTINAIGSTKGYTHVGSYNKPGEDPSTERQQSFFDKKQ